MAGLPDPSVELSGDDLCCLPRDGGTTRRGCTRAGLCADVQQPDVAGEMVAAFDIAIESDFAPFVPAWAQEGAPS